MVFVCWCSTKRQPPLKPPQPPPPLADAHPLLSRAQGMRGSRQADGVSRVRHSERGRLNVGLFGFRAGRRALRAMLCVSVSIHSRRGALSVLPRTCCQTPLPPPSMLPLRGQPAEWRTSLPGCPRTCVSHTHTTHTLSHALIDFYAHWSVSCRIGCFSFGKTAISKLTFCISTFWRFWLFLILLFEVRQTKIHASTRTE